MSMTEQPTLQVRDYTFVVVIDESMEDNHFEFCADGLRMNARMWSLVQSDPRYAEYIGYVEDQIIALGKAIYDEPAE